MTDQAHACSGQAGGRGDGRAWLERAFRDRYPYSIEDARYHVAAADQVRAELLRR